MSIEEFPNDAEVVVTIERRGLSSMLVVRCAGVHVK
jgi:hypothetical protein